LIFVKRVIPLIRNASCVVWEQILPEKFSLNFVLCMLFYCESIANRRLIRFSARTWILYIRKKLLCTLKLAYLEVSKVFHHQITLQRRHRVIVSICEFRLFLKLRSNWDNTNCCKVIFQQLGIVRCYIERINRLDNFFITVRANVLS
jgi:hypothetical protein